MMGIATERESGWWLGVEMVGTALTCGSCGSIMAVLWQYCGSIVAPRARQDRTRHDSYSLSFNVGCARVRCAADRDACHYPDIWRRMVLLLPTGREGLNGVR